MTTILHVASSSNTASSYTRQVGPEVMNNLKTAYPGAKIIDRDLVKKPVPHVSPEFVANLRTNPEAPALALSRELAGELMESDVIVIEAPMYKFGIPAVLKAWIDHVIRSGVTFKYGEKGPEGLAKGKKAILVLGRGGIYSEGPFKVMDFQESYLRAVLGFIGITNIESVLIEGVAMGPDKAAAEVEKAKKQASGYAKAA